MSNHIFSLPSRHLLLPLTQLETESSTIKLCDKAKLLVWVSGTTHTTGYLWTCNAMPLCLLCADKGFGIYSELHGTIYMPNWNVISEIKDKTKINEKRKTKKCHCTNAKQTITD